MQYSADEKALIWLASCPELELREKLALLDFAPSPQILFENFEKFFSEVIFKDQKGVYKKSNLPQREKELAVCLEQLSNKNFFAVTIASEDYPKALAAIEQPPIVLFGAGNRALLKDRMFCIVGSRRTPAWAETFGTRTAEELSEHFTIVTGLAEGGDTAALKGALSGKKAVCVLPCGLDECYPASHLALKERVMREGLLLSEFPLGEKTKKYSFHARNRILAGLSLGTLVLSAGEKSGALITAGHAVDFGRDVFALPYSIGVSQGVGCNMLIKRGAFLCTCTQDILDNFGIFSSPKKSVELTEEQERVMEILKEEEECHIALLAERSGMQIFELAAVLSELELLGFAVKVGGNCFKSTL